ncbi:hypothetical protein [uncultured Ramlibacter sp.]|uniref:hypothetical protein n=1 Tax=uncultured Ramlibacter sp. TaxID=260755 RepID=UPI002608BDAE|nr:hypothetical protein [uncultured Ramlibacter sp.]
MRKLFALCLAVLLAGCAGGFVHRFEVPPGTPREAVIARLGTPTRAVPLANGERLQYSLQPFGRATWMVDFDASGKALGSRQVLTEANFHRIEVGKWTLADVEREFGPPATVDRVGSWNGPVLTWRWYDSVGAEMLYHVYLDPQGVVQRAHPTMELFSVRERR